MSRKKVALFVNGYCGGIAEFNKETDQCFADVFKRADAIMYKKKAEMKLPKVNQLYIKNE